MLQSFERALMEQLNLARYLQDKQAFLLEVFQFSRSFFDLKNRLRFSMPPGFETAEGLTDPVSGDICLNAALWPGLPWLSPLQTLLHELRHSIQATRPELFPPEIAVNNTHVIQFDGTGYRIRGSEAVTVKLPGAQDYYTELYLASPCERDANAFAHRCLKAAGAGAEADEHYQFWSPRWTHFTEAQATDEFLNAAAEIDRLAAEEEPT